MGLAMVTRPSLLLLATLERSTILGAGDSLGRSCPEEVPDSPFGLEWGAVGFLSCTAIGVFSAGQARQARRVSDANTT